MVSPPEISMGNQGDKWTSFMCFNIFTSFILNAEFIPKCRSQHASGFLVLNQCILPVKNYAAQLALEALCLVRTSV